MPNSAVTTTLPYFVASSRTRQFPQHGFTVQTLSAKRFKENTTPLSFSVTLFLPFLQRFNTRLEEHIQKEEDIDNEKIKRHVLECSQEALVHCTDVLSRVAVQTAIACVLVEKDHPVGNAVVYSWDMYPRLHQKYLGDLLAVIRLPRFLASALGPATQQEDLRVFDVKVSPIAAMEDSLKRSCLGLCGDLVVGNVRIVLSSVSSSTAATTENNNSVSVPTKMVTYTRNSILSVLCRACGAAVGNTIAAGRGDYFGEFVGSIASTVIVAKLMVSNAKKAASKPKSNTRR